jgi:hypothetical protein
MAVGAGVGRRMQTPRSDCGTLEGSFRGHETVPGPRDRTYRGYLVRENSWLQLQHAHICVLTGPSQPIMLTATFEVGAHMTYDGMGGR